MTKQKQNEFVGLTFEEAFERLEQAVEAMDGGDLSLDEAMAHFEEGMKLAQYCERLLDDAELRVQQLLTDSAGSLTLASFESEH
ncbi:MAG TPA: exodeoxyribonuclease VII small subunit [Ktedonobacterales bacterium]|jgi:exodeoxyribonuclease VII small subunit